MIPYAKHDLSEEDVDAVVSTLREAFITQGPVVPSFEQAFGQYVQAEHSVAVNSGTAALHVACRALDLGPGDILWTSPISFVASANCGIYCGASVDFVDIDPETGLMSVSKLAEKLRAAADTDCLPKVVIPVHYAGQCCDMEKIFALAGEYGFRIIEDACHALGGRFQGEPVGSCKFSHISTFSFHPAKVMTTAEGGMAATNDADLASKMRKLRSHGISRDESDMPSAMNEVWYYQQLMEGFNYRMPDVLAAMGISQLKRVDHFVERRGDLANLYTQQIKGLPVKPLRVCANQHSGHHLYVVRTPVTGGRALRDSILHGLQERGIGANLHYIAIHTQPFYRKCGFQPSDFPDAVAFSDQVLSLPLYASLTEADLAIVVDALRESVELGVRHRS